MEVFFAADKWLVLVVSLPASNASMRMRLWRAMKALGCATLREGVYLLPVGQSQSRTLRMHAGEIRQGGGSAYLLDIANLQAEENSDFQSLFDRSEEYSLLMGRIAEFRSAIGTYEATAGRRQLKVLRRDFEALVALDYFPGSKKHETSAMLVEAESEFFARVTPGEPRTVEGSIALRASADYRGRLWATRKHLWVDRVASAWLILHFIDPDANFLWLEKPEDCPVGALGFDFDGAEFTHVGRRVTFEVLLASFGLESDPALMKLAALVHCLDVGGSAVAEAAGVETVLGGLRACHPDDDALLVAAGSVFDGIYMNFKSGESA